VAFSSLIYPAPESGNQIDDRLLIFQRKQSAWLIFLRLNVLLAAINGASQDPFDKAMPGSFKAHIAGIGFDNG
jgi:hypothetical protein